ncbi:MAG: YbfB/YjiJ family MFS transporter [Candidatus Omnitrophica bacterium]|nr:YbfB/YjiJ family MFS transporter [Candidatus Omnitrophota bacterium]
MKIRIVLTGMVSMVVAMGLGRFALTPQVPHMLAEGYVDLTQASLLAASNFLGYLLGAIELTAAKDHRHMILRMKTGLWASGIILLLSAFIPNHPWGFYLNLLLRFAAGVASAWALILVTTWVQHELIEHHSLRTIAFAGPGVGIFVSGLLAIGFDIWHTNASENWFIYGLVAIVAGALIVRNLPKALPQSSSEERFPFTPKIYLLIGIYVLAAIGYVLPATFLSKLAVDKFPGSLIADIFWPLFGFAVIIGMAILARQKNIKRPQKGLAITFCIQGLGILSSIFLPGITGLFAGALLVGGTFMAIMQLMLQLGVSLAPRHIRTLTGLLTIGFAIGQFIGPLLSAASTHYLSSMTPALCIAALGSLMASILISFV